MYKKEFRMLIKYCLFMEKILLKQSIDWYAEFKRGRTNTDEAERSGRPKSAVVSENIKKSTK